MDEKRIIEIVKEVARRMIFKGTDPFDYDDAVQEAVITLWMVVMKKGHVSEAFLRNKARWVILDYFRSRSKKEERLSSSLHNQGSMESRVSKDKAISRLVKISEDLKTRQRLGIQKYLFEGWSISEIAEYFGVSVPTAWRIVNRGLSEVKERISLYNPFL